MTGHVDRFVVPNTSPPTPERKIIFSVVWVSHFAVFTNNFIASTGKHGFRLSTCDASLFRRAEVFLLLTGCSGDHEALGKKSAARDDEIFSTWSTASNILLGTFSASQKDKLAMASFPFEWMTCAFIHSHHRSSWVQRFYFSSTAPQIDNDKRILSCARVLYRKEANKALMTRERTNSNPHFVIARNACRWR